MGLCLNLKRRPNGLRLRCSAVHPVLRKLPELVREVEDPGLEVEMECVDLARVFARAAADVTILDATVAAAFCLHADQLMMILGSRWVGSSWGWFREARTQRAEKRVDHRV